MFVDTNVLVYARFQTAPHHQIARDAIQRAAHETDSLAISRQIIREYLAVVTRPQDWSRPIPSQNASIEVDRLLTTFEILEDFPQVTDILLQLCRETPVGGRQIHDANIVATMLAHGEHQLLTFNSADFQRFADSIEIVNAQPQAT